MADKLDSFEAIIDHYLSLPANERKKIDDAIRESEDRKWLFGKGESCFNTHIGDPGM